MGTRTSHLSITIVLALPIWLGTIFYSIIFQYNNLLAHLVPLGTPSFLIPIMVVIETVRNIISLIIIRILLVRLILLLILEVAVACIQSYVFTILSSLYLNELIRNSFNKKVLN